MPSASAHDVKVADEVWIATALLHRKRPAMVDFTIEEIVESARKEAITANQRPGTYVHVLQHCVANRPPNPGRYCMLLETEKGRRRLWKPGDPVDPKRIGAKTVTRNRWSTPSASAGRGRHLTACRCRSWTSWARGRS